VEACATRLRLVVADSGRVSERELKALGAHGVLRLADGAVQVVVGPIADQLASEIREGLRHAGASATPAANPMPRHLLISRPLEYRPLIHRPLID
jgi:PTS system N-acetylglucosamine-specific IIC component